MSIKIIKYIQLMLFMPLLLSCNNTSEEDNMKISIDCSEINEIEYRVTNVTIEERVNGKFQVVQNDVYVINKNKFCEIIKIIKNNRLNSNIKDKLLGGMTIYTNSKVYGFTLFARSLISNVDTNKKTYIINEKLLIELLEKNKTFKTKETVYELPL